MKIDAENVGEEVGAVDVRTGPRVTRARQERSGRRGWRTWIVAAVVATPLIVAGVVFGLGWFNSTPPAVKGTDPPPLAPANGTSATSGDATAYSTGSGVLFDVDSSSLRPEAEAALERIVAQIKASGAQGIVRVDGYTDDYGPDDYNDRLSKARAETVAQWLVHQGGIPGPRVKSYYFGETHPAQPNDTDEHRQANRRVVITSYR